ncbi:MAG: DUF4393 domain-containing protein [Bacteroidetes bacterium]|nr:DUF4393 domain-containing protein [Bacteroidota bacterium]
MSEQNKEPSENKVSETINAVTGLVKTVPVYTDTIQPAAKEIGKTLETVAKTVNVALFPLKALVWSFEKLQIFIDTKVSEKLKNTPESEIKTPNQNMVVPFVIIMSGDEPELQELFANLIASSMDNHTSNFVHPSFVETIKQLTPDEAKILRYISKEANLPTTIAIRSESSNLQEGGWDMYRHVSLFGEKAFCVNPHLTSVALDNFIRLGIIEIRKDYSYTEKKIYSELMDDKEVKEVIENINKTEGRKVRIVEEMVIITDFGANS